MQYTHLGRTNLAVSRFCLGTMMFGGKTPADESERIVGAALDQGVNFIDTADVYAGGRSEEIVGRAIHSRRDRVVLASKGGMRMGGEGPTDLGLSRFHIVRAVEASLRRLNTDRIDLYYMHWPERALNLEEALRALDDLVRQGKILYPAFSNFPAWLAMHALSLGQLNGYAPVVAGQYPYNLIERGIEVEILPMAAAMGVGITIYRSLAIGTLTGKYLGANPEQARGQDDERIGRWNELYGEGIEKLKSFAKAHGYSCADAANAWVASHPAVAAPIIGISRMEQLEHNLRAADWRLTDEERQELTTYFPTEPWEETGGAFPGWRRSFEIMAPSSGPVPRED